MRKKNKEVVDWLVINGWKVLLDWVVDVTDKPMINYVGFSHEWPVFLRPSLYEDRSEWSCIITEQDGDRVRYRVYWRNIDVACCDTREDAEDVLIICEDRQREAEHCKEDYFNF